MREIPLHINDTRAHFEIEMYMFPQVWGSTALGFGGIGGQAMRAAYTTVVVETQYNWCAVFFGETMAYLISNPKDVFFEDVKRHNMAPVSQHGKYVRSCRETSREQINVS